MDKKLFIGDSHIFSCFSSDEDIMYIIDITLNKIRKGGSDLNVRYSDYDKVIESDRYTIDEEGDSIIEIINESEHNHIVLSIGEIDVRYHLINQLSSNKNAIIDIVSIYGKFLDKIDKNKKISICSITPPGIDNANKYTKMINQRSEITISLNLLLKDLCELNGYGYIDLYSNYQIGGILDNTKSDGGVHIHSRFIESNLNKIK